MFTQAQLDRERFLDMGNYNEFLLMDRSHLGKGKIKNFNAAVKRWKKETERHRNIIGVRPC